MNTNVVECIGCVTNTIIATLLPYFSDFSARLNLAEKAPITLECISRQAVLLDRDVQVSIVLTNGSVLMFENGFVGGYDSHASFSRLEDPNRLKEFAGNSKLTKSDAVGFARQSITSLGYSLEDVYADLPPNVEYVGQIRGEQIPFFKIIWKNPNKSLSGAEIEVDGRDARIVHIMLASQFLNKPPPEIEGCVLRKKPELERISIEESRNFIVGMSPMIELYVTNLNLPVAPGSWTNEATRITLYKSRWGTIDGNIMLENGYKFYSDGGAITGFDSPKRFFKPSDVRVKDFIGKGRMSERQMIKMAKEVVAKLGFAPKSLSMEKKPYVTRPYVHDPEIPRCEMEWHESGSRVVFEFNTDSKTIEGMRLYAARIYDSYRDKR